MNSDDALRIVLAEAFSEQGLVMLAHEGQDPGHFRMEKLISAINYLAEELSKEDHLDRQLVSALFALATVLETFGDSYAPSSESRASLYQQAGDLIVAINHLVENWDNWPDLDELSKFTFDEPADERDHAAPADEEFEGYQVGDITYCVLPETNDFFPVRVVRLGFNVIEVEPLSEASCASICEPFLEHKDNRYFRLPQNPPAARFGGFDERLVNLDRITGPELRLLPYHYATTTGELIKQRHATDPLSWPLPTGVVYERWFKNKETGDR